MANISRTSLAMSVGLALLGAADGTAVPVTKDFETVQVRPYLFGPIVESSSLTTAIPTVEKSQSATSSDLVLELREATSFTWDQLSKLFGVSRRTVHLWAAGGNISAHNEERLVSLTKEIQQIVKSDAQNKRVQMFELLDRERASQASTDNDINRPATIYKAEV